MDRNLSLVRPAKSIAAAFSMVVTGTAIYRATPRTLGRGFLHSGGLRCSEGSSGAEFAEPPQPYDRAQHDDHGLRRGNRRLWKEEHDSLTPATHARVATFHGMLGSNPAVLAHAPLRLTYPNGFSSLRCLYKLQVYVRVWWIAACAIVETRGRRWRGPEMIPSNMTAIFCAILRYRLRLASR